MYRQGHVIGEGGRLCRLARSIVALGLSSVLVAACIQGETTVRVGSDGGGVIIDRFLVSHDLIEMFGFMMPEGEAFDLYDEAQLREQAGQYGVGVSLLASHRVENGFGSGYEARYGFADIEALAISPDPGRNMPNDGMEPEAEGDPDAPVTFTLRQTEPAELVIHWPVDDDMTESGEEAETTPSGEPDPAELDMIKAMMQGLRIAMYVEFAGEIVETNATFQEGSRITLAEIVLDDILGDASALKQFAVAEPKTLADVKKMVAGFPGLKLEVEPEVRVSFR